MKIILKKFLLILLLICILVPSLFSGFAIAADANADPNMKLTQERAGNFVANFAINFYDNWSSVGVVEGSEGVVGSTGGNSSVVASAQKIFDRIVRDNPEYNASQSNSFKIVEQPEEPIPYIDCSAFVAAVIYDVTGERFRQDFSCTALYNEFIGDNGRANYPQWEIKTNRECIEDGDITLQPGDILVSKTDGHADIYKEDNPNSYEISAGYYGYDAWDCGSRDNWSPVADYAGIKHVWKTSDTSYEAMRIRIKSGSSSSSQTTSAKIRGEIRTRYNPDVSPNAEVKPDDNPYEFSNLSWISFVYKEALEVSDIITSDKDIDSKRFDSYNPETESFESEYTNNDVIDISTLMSSGKVLPGDIFYISNGNNGGEFVLYVGGTKILYATPPIEGRYATNTQTDNDNKDEEDNGNNTDEGENKENEPKEQNLSALKYEYIQYYLQRVKKELIKGHEDEEDFEIPKYGVTKVYRLNESIATNLTEANTNLIFNGKGYYSYSKYDGVPEVNYAGASKYSFAWIFDGILGIFRFIVNVIVYAIRMQVIGWANLLELLIQGIVLGISGSNNATPVEPYMGGIVAGTTTDRITIESVFFNKIPILDANFFNFESAGGRSLMVTTEVSGPVEFGKEVVTTQIVDETNIVYQLRKNLAFWYTVIRNASIAVLLFVLLYLGVRLAITASSEKKAEYKKLLVSWVTGFAVVLFIHYFMFIILYANEAFVNLCCSIGNAEALNLGVESQQQLNLYEAIKTKAYAFNFTEGLPATIMYIFLIYLLIRYLFIYLKRYVTIYILAIYGAFMGVKYAYDKIAGKKTTSLNKWMKDFAFNVLLQTIHAFSYVIFMSTAMRFSEDSLAGFVLSFVILNTMLSFDKSIMKIFSLDSATVGEVDEPGSWKSLLKKFYPMFTAYSTVWNYARNAVTNENGFINKIRYAALGKEGYKDSKKALEKRRYQRIGERTRKRINLANSNRRSIRVLAARAMLRMDKYANYKALLGDGQSSELNKKTFATIRDAKKLNREKFTRKVQYIGDMAFGIGGMVAAIPAIIENPVAGMTVFNSSKNRVKRHITRTKLQRKNSRYGISTETAKLNQLTAQTRYDTALNTYADNEFDYQQQREALLNRYLLASSGNKPAIQSQIDALDNARKEQRAIEMHTVESAYEKLEKSKIIYQNAKHENGTINKVLTAIGTPLGATILAEIATDEDQEIAKRKEKAGNKQSKLKDLENIAKLERELIELNQQLYTKNRYIDSSGNVDTVLLNRELDKTVKEAKKQNIKSVFIKQAINSYLFENNVSKITNDDVDGVLAKLETVMHEAGKNIRFSDDTKAEVKKRLKEKMIEEQKGLGYDTKDAIINIRRILGEDGVIKPTSTSAISENDVRSIHEQIMQKIKEINTYNQVGQVKYKESIVNINKIIENARKKK